MAEPFLAEIRVFSFNFAPKGWAFCDGQLLPINQNQAVFSLLGTTFGGNGTTNFALPDLRDRIPFHPGNGLVQGQRAGNSSHTLGIGELPAHTHLIGTGASPASTANPTNAYFAGGGQTVYAATPDTPLLSSTVSSIGGNQPHENMPPFLTLNFCIALQGIFPSPT